MIKDSESDQSEFSGAYTENFPKILNLLNVSLAVTSYQSSRLIFIRTDGKKINTHFKEFMRPMGIYADDVRITLGTLNEVVDFRRVDLQLKKIHEGKLDNLAKLSHKLVDKQEDMAEIISARQESLTELKQADALYVQRASTVTGMINIHDIAWGVDGLWVVNSAFSCLCTLSSDASFEARWKPPFISKLTPEDRCHLNGMAMRDGRPRYVTTFNRRDTIDSWVEQGEHEGTLIDVQTNEVLLDGLIMPHSPRYHKGNIYVCESGQGSVWRLDPVTGNKTMVVQLPGFTRGMYFYDDIMIVGLSRVKESNTKQALPIKGKYDVFYCGVWLINLQDGSEIAHLKFDEGIDQVYGIAVIPDSTMPDLLNASSIITRHLFDFTNKVDL